MPPGKAVALGELVGAATSNAAHLPSFVGGRRDIKLATLAANPINTRDLKRDPDKLAELVTSMRVDGQIQACAGVNRAAFLAIFPEHAKSIGDATIVQVTGGRRRLAAVELGMETLRVDVLDDLAESRVRFIRATGAENLDRDDLDPIEEAKMVEMLVGELGEGKAAAEQLGKTPAWVTQRLNLLKLDAAVQAAIVAREIPLREVRDLHKRSSAEQLTALEAWRNRTTAPASTDPEADAGHPRGTGSAAAPRQRLSPTAAAFQRLGGTPSKIAGALRSQMQPDEIAELIRLLTEQ